MTMPEPISIDLVLNTLFTLNPDRAHGTQDDFVGRSTRVLAEVRNVYRDDPTAAISVFAVRNSDPRGALLDAGFLLRFLAEEDKVVAARLDRRVSIDVVGRIEECAEGVVVLSDCVFASPPGGLTDLENGTEASAS